MLVGWLGLGARGRPRQRARGEKREGRGMARVLFWPEDISPLVCARGRSRAGEGAKGAV